VDQKGYVPFCLVLHQSWLVFSASNSRWKQSTTSCLVRTTIDLVKWWWRNNSWGESAEGLDERCCNHGMLKDAVSNTCGNALTPAYLRGLSIQYWFHRLLTSIHSPSLCTKRGFLLDNEKVSSLPFVALLSINCRQESEALPSRPVVDLSWCKPCHVYRKFPIHVSCCSTLFAPGVSLPTSRTTPRNWSTRNVTRLVPHK